VFPNGLRSLAHHCVRAIDAVSAILVFAISALVFAQVIVRYVLGGSLVWSEELTRVLFVWMVLLAASTADPMRIDFVIRAVPTRVAAMVSAIAECVVFGLTCYLLWGAWGMVDLTADDRFTALDVSVSWIYVALLVAAALWLVRSAIDVVQHLSAAVRSDS
jgi:TRAP-type C4-dicarboxylate transport system permease small subunit